VEVLLGVLRRGGGGTPAPVPGLLELALRGVVAVVHVLHGSSPGAGPVPLRVLLDGYFRVLNSDLPVASLAPEAAGGLIALRVLMLGRWLGDGDGDGDAGWVLSCLHLAVDAIPAMLSCEDRPVLQAVFLSNNCFEHIIRLLQNSKVPGWPPWCSPLVTPGLGTLGTLISILTLPGSKQCWGGVAAVQQHSQGGDPP